MSKLLLLPVIGIFLLIVSLPVIISHRAIESKRLQKIETEKKEKERLEHLKVKKEALITKIKEVESEKDIILLELKKKYLDNLKNYRENQKIVLEIMKEKYQKKKNKIENEKYELSKQLRDELKKFDH